MARTRAAAARRDAGPPWALRHARRRGVILSKIFWRRRMGRMGLGLSWLAMVGLSSGCSSSSPAVDGGSVPDGPKAMDAAPSLSYKPSNVDLTGLDLSKVADIIVSGA